MVAEGEMEPWRKRVGLIAAILGIAVSLGVAGAFTWAILQIYIDKSQMQSIHAQITQVVSSKRSSSGTRFRFGKYTLNVSYRIEDGREVKNSVEKSTYGFPSEGDSITILRDPKTGHIEADPFPELWIIPRVVYALFGGLIWMFARGIKRVLSWDEGRISRGAGRGDEGG